MLPQRSKEFVLKKKTGEERRRSKRTVVQESFNLFLVVPELHGMSRIYIRDISSCGLCFHTELKHGLKEGQEVEARCYLNPGFYLPLDCKVVRVQGDEIALEFAEAGAGLAIGKLQEFFESAEKYGVMVE